MHLIARLWINLLLFPFPLNYVYLNQYPDWLIGLSLRLMVTVAECAVTLTAYSLRSLKAK